MKKEYIIFGILFIIVLGLIIFISKQGKVDETYDFKIHFFNAAKADAILISKGDKYLMIDTGESSLSNEIINYFKKNNIKKLEYLIITHFDKDHVGSASKVIDNFEIEEVLTSNYPKNSIYYSNYIESLNKKNIEPKVINGNYDISFADLNIIVNGPDKIYDSNESNNSSLITSIKYRNNSFLFMGDIENARIKDFLSENNETYDFLKVPYHGKYLKRLDDILKEKGIKYAVITNNKIDSKTKVVLDNYNINYYLTKNNIDVYSNGNIVKIKQF